MTSDNGASFTNRTTAHGLADNYINKIEVIDGVIYAATQKGLSVSTDGGTSFTSYTTDDGITDLNVRAVTAGGGKIYTLTAGGLSVSEQ